MRCKVCEEEMVLTEVPKEVFSIKLFIWDFMVLWMNRQEWICYACAAEKHREPEDRIWQAGYEQCAKEIREVEGIR